MSIFGVLALLERLEGRFSGLFAGVSLRTVVGAQENVLFCGAPCRLVMRRRKNGLVV